MAFTNKTTLVGIATLFVLSLAVVPNVLAQGAEQTDAMLVSATGSASEVGYCGVGRNAEPWTLHIAASRLVAGGSAGKLKVEFRNGSSITLQIGPNNSISLVQQMGGGPGDDLVRITLDGGTTPTGGAAGAKAWVTARARPNAADPFIEPAVQQDDNFCVNIITEGSHATLLAVPDSWVTDTFGDDGGTLQ